MPTTDIDVWIDLESDPFEADIFLVAPPESSPWFEQCTQRRVRLPEGFVLRPKSPPIAGPDWQPCSIHNPKGVQVLLTRYDQKGVWGFVVDETHFPFVESPE